MSASDTRVDLRLQIGQVTQQVTVTEAVPTVETTSSEVSQIVDQQVIQQIPLNARDIQQLAVVNPGVQWMKTSYGGNQLSVSGDRPSNNRYLQEGMDMTWSYRLSPISLASGIMLGTEAVKEFKVMTSNFTVEYGEQSGGVVNTLFKSGTNGLRGSAYEYYRNSDFDARNFFDQAPGESPPPFHVSWSLSGWTDSQGQNVLLPKLRGIPPQPFAIASGRPAGRHFQDRCCPGNHEYLLQPSIPWYPLAMAPKLAPTAGYASITAIPSNR